MEITLIAALSENRVLATADGRIPWHLPDEVQHFRNYCQGKWLLAGRKTWEQMDGWFRPGQTPMVLSRSAATLTVPGGYAVPDVASGFRMAASHGALECVVIGGGQVFAAALPSATRLILTDVHTITPAGGALFPEVPADAWTETERLFHPADAEHAFAFTIRHLARSPLPLSTP